MRARFRHLGAAALLALGLAAPAKAWYAAELEEDWFLAVPRESCQGTKVKCHLNPQHFDMVGLTDAPKSCHYTILAMTIWKKPRNKREVAALAMAMKPMAASPEEIAWRWSDHGNVKRNLFTRRTDTACERFEVTKDNGLVEFFVVREGPTFAALWVVYSNDAGEPADCRTPQFSRDVFDRMALSIGKTPPKLPMLQKGEPPREQDNSMKGSFSHPTETAAPRTPESNAPVAAPTTRAERLRAEAEARRNAQALVTEARDFLKAGSIYLCEQKVDAALEADPKSIDALIIHALAMKLAGEVDKEAKDISQARTRKADLRGAAASLLGGPGPIPDGLAADWRGDHPSALGFFEVAVSVDPSSWLALALRAMARISLNDCNAARSDLREAVRKNPNYSMYTSRAYNSVCEERPR